MAVKRPSDRAFGFAFAGFSGLLATIVWLTSGNAPRWAVVISGTLALLAVVAPGSLMPLNRLWALLGRRVTGISNHVLLGSFFYLVVLPLGLLARLAGRISMPRRFDPSADSYWKPVGRQANPESYPDMF